MTSKVTDLSLIRAAAEKDCRKISALDALRLAIDAIERGEIDPAQVLIIAKTVPDAEGGEYHEYFAAGLTNNDRIAWFSKGWLYEMSRE